MARAENGRGGLVITTHPDLFRVDNRERALRWVVNVVASDIENNILRQSI